MTDRYSEQAAIITDHCLSLESGDTVSVEAPPPVDETVIILSYVVEK